jgi:hypothetical protein
MPRLHMDANAIDPGTEDAVKRFLSRIADRYDMVVHFCTAAGHAARIDPTATLT